VNFSQIELDDPSLAAWREMREFLDKHLDEAVLEHERVTGDRHSIPFHAALAARGWVAPKWPVDEGGAALDPVLASILEAELVARQLPQVTRAETLMSVLAVRSHGTAELRDAVVPAVARGEMRMTLGWTEPDCGSDIAASRTRAVRSGDRWIINGSKRYSTGAHNCTHSFLLTRTNLDVPKHKGLTMFLCPLDLPGVTITPVRTLGGERTNAVFFADVEVDDFWRIGNVDDGWIVLQGPLAADQGGHRQTPLWVGDAPRHTPLGRALDAAVEWARQPGPDGRAPIDDRAVRARLARVELDLEISAVAPAGPFHKVTESELLIRDAADLLDLLGPAGYLTHGGGAPGNGAVEHAHRFSPGTSIYSGTNDIHRTMIAERHLGLPRSRPTDRRQPGQ
jgi:alkylation response protein AidB-like acyl-CoA dehydrogenase